MQKDQHFMTDAGTIKRMVSLAGISPDETVIEIGAGRGALTKELAGVSKKVIAIEVDRRLGIALKHQFKDQRNVSILVKNALNADLSADRLVGNIPYAICEPLVRRLIKYRFKKAVFTVSKSFVHRLLAKPGDRNYSGLSAFAQKNFIIAIEMGLSKDVFEPRPKTNSVVISLIPRR